MTERSHLRCVWNVDWPRTTANALSDPAVRSNALLLPESEFDGWKQTKAEARHNNA